MDYDRTNGNLLLFGFGGPSLQTPMTWTWDGTNWNEKHPLHAPTFRDGAGLAFGARSGIVLFGGFNGEGDSQGFNDTWVWDGSDWQPRHPAHTPASGPVYMVHEDARQDVLVLASNGTWIWNGTDWMQRASAASSPPFRAFAAMAYDATGARVVFFGGKDPSTNQPTGETWTWDGTGWTRASVQP
jgi:hypothetical protein